ncbi:SRPBCC family protein [Novosphingobium sp. BL-52-GroH]|uniref:SRPBCC family protein n=1 Tax=Novosphingobium sp. BL-52-GroH TaxID=3349877 RepID=UPI003850DB3A
MKHLAFALAAASAILGPVPAAAKVAQVDANGFVIRHVAQVSTSVEETWAVLLKPSVWWDSEHTWSGDAANLTLDARAGGCFCEILPNATSPKASPRGSVEHMRVIYVERPRALRMVGALGPLQSDAATATLTIQLKPEGKGGTQILLEYVVGGYTRTPFDKMAPAVDGVLGEQVRRLSEKLGGAFSAAFPLPDAAPAPRDGEGAPVAVPEPVEAEPAADGVIPLSDAPPSSDGTIVGR